MKFFAMIINEETLPLVTELNEGVAPGLESMNNMFVYPASKLDDAESAIITHQEFQDSYVIFDVNPLYILEVK